MIPQGVYGDILNWKSVYYFGYVFSDVVQCNSLYARRTQSFYYLCDSSIQGNIFLRLTLPICAQTHGQYRPDDGPTL